ncbi:hypothetical protein [Viscerimonas tarda]
MARQDIHADPQYGELTVTDNLINKLVREFAFSGSIEGEDNDNFCYGEITVPPGFERKLEGKAGIHVRIPYIPVFKELKIRFRIDSGDGSTQYVVNPTDNSRWFPVFMPDEAGGKIPVRLSGYHTLNDDGVFSLVMQGGCLLLFSGNETDLEIKASLAQNEVFLLKAMAGNLYQHPVTGVGLIEFLHGNFENNSLAQKLQQEFENDGMIISEAYMDSATGELYLDVKEKNG